MRLKKLHFLIGTLIAIISVQWSLSNANAHTSELQDEGRFALLSGAYEFSNRVFDNSTSTHNSMFKIDTKTGSTWILDGSRGGIKWLEIEQERKF